MMDFTVKSMRDEVMESGETDVERLEFAIGLLTLINDPDRIVIRLIASKYGIAPAAAKMLNTLAVARGRVVSAEFMLDQLNSVSEETHTIAIRISKIRKKLKELGYDPESIVTAYGAGYAMMPDMCNEILNIHRNADQFVPDISDIVSNARPGVYLRNGLEWTQDEIEYVENLIKQGWLHSEIAIKIGRSERAVTEKVYLLRGKKE